jgi:subtilisin family serine protease
MSDPSGESPGELPAGRPHRRFAVSPALRPDTSGTERREVVQVGDDGRSPVLVELDLTADVKTGDTRERFKELFAAKLQESSDRHPLVDIADTYVRCFVTPEEAQQLLRADRETTTSRPTIFRLWPDYRVEAHIDRSISTIKSDAAARAYAASGDGIVWAVIDSGIDRSHPHFSTGTFDDEVVSWSRDFTYLVPDQPGQPPADGGAPFDDPDGHGTHVAGILAGRAPEDMRLCIGTQVAAVEGLPKYALRELPPGGTLTGMAPKCRLVSLRVLMPQPDGLPITSSSAVIEALHHVRSTLNDGGRNLRVHGVNLSLGCPWDPHDYAAGQSPLCREVDLLVGTGVVVVVSAGNNGATGGSGRDVRGQLGSITDPGNAAGAITVGSTHRDSPHRFGVTFDSSKGPTFDGRIKPDVIAPGERITSAATGAMAAVLTDLTKDVGDAAHAVYIEDSGTSMSAPHVSGAIAAFLSVRREFIGMPDEVKRLFCDNATSLGRDRYLEGHGLIDLMRVLASV